MLFPDCVLEDLDVLRIEKVFESVGYFEKKDIPHRLLIVEVLISKLRVEIKDFETIFREGQ